MAGACHNRWKRDPLRCKPPWPLTAQGRVGVWWWRASPSAAVQRNGMPAASSITGEDVFCLFSAGFRCLSPHTIPLTALWSLMCTLQVTHARHPGEGWDSQPHAVGCVRALPLFYCLLKAVKLKGGEKESIEDLQSLVNILRAWLSAVFSKLVWGSYLLLLSARWK